MNSRHTSFICALLLITSLAVYAQKPNKNGYGNFFRKADQKVEIAAAPATLQTAHRKCENYAWAAILESMMRAQAVNIPQDDWAIRTSNGMKCFPTLNDYAERALAITADYALDGGRKVHIDGSYTPGALADPATFVNSIRLGRPLMVVLNSRPYMLYAVIYDELIHTTGATGVQYVLKEMKLLDAALPPGNPKRIVSFATTPETIGQITGVMSVSVASR
ncbi:MAG: hypothetical protein JWO13_203 [Acidobacteriales bacterium]|nr:hypothetical protein [Terriglobales bacterium]